jgi:ABC-type branched-subunit amino acid transport system permease subunit
VLDQQDRLATGGAGSVWGPVVGTLVLAVASSACSRPVARFIRHARYFVLQLTESHLTSTLFRQILGRIARLGWHPT